MMNMKNFGTVTGVIALILISFMWFGGIDAHVENTLIHNDHKALSETFVPRTEIEVQLNSIYTQLDALSEDITYIRSNIKVK